MARIPPEEIDRLKTETSLIRLVEASGIALTKQGKDHVGLCPFHEEDTPSFRVSEEKNVFNCFGCGAGGSVIDWMIKRNGVSFRHAVELLREGVQPVTDRAVKHSTVPVLPSPVTVEADDRKALGQVIDYYHRKLKQAPEALEYLNGRGINNPELIETFRLGYADRSLGTKLPKKNRKEGAALRARLEKIGLYRDTGHEHFSGSFVVPVLDEQGGVVGAYGRKITPGLRPGTPLHLYLPGPHRGVWNVQALKAHKEIILCEALIDAMTFWCAGFRNVTAAYGVNGFTPEMLEAFKSHGIKRVLIAFDRDEPGDRGAEEVAALLMGAGMECWRILFPKGMDANEYALKVQPAAKSLGVLIRKAEWLGKGTAPARDVREPETAFVPVAEPLPHATKEEVPGSDIGSSLSSLAAINQGPAVAPAPMPASPVPPAPPADLPVEVSETEAVFTFPARRWRVKGLPKNLAAGILKVNVMVSQGDRFHVDTFDFYAARPRGVFTQQAAGELRVPEEEIKVEAGRVLLKLEQLHDEQTKKALAPAEPAHPEMTDDERATALELLRAPELIERILADFGRCGMIGEEINVLTAYLAATSRKLESPLGVVIQSGSAGGKSAVMDAVLAFMPDDHKVQYSAVTGQSLYYMGKDSLKNKVLAIAEEQGAQRASYALKLLQSEGELVIASTGQDSNGNLITKDYRVEGPAALITTTTQIDLDEELMNRCLVLAVDEGRDQTAAIHEAQRTKRTFEGLQAKEEKTDILALHRNAQRLLQPLAVVNPYADRLTFLDNRTRTRRDHEKYLTLIDTIALLHQHQRQIRTFTRGERTISYIEATRADIVRATALAHEVLGRSLDELPPQTRRLLNLIRQMVTERAAAHKCKPADIRFSRRELREFTGQGDTQLRLHLDRLTRLEYVLTHSGRRGQNFVYELLHDGGESAKPHLSGLIDAETLPESMPMTPTSRGSDPRFAGSTRGQRGPKTGGSRGDESEEAPITTGLPAENADSTPESPILNGHDKTLSYNHPLAALASGHDD